MVSFLLNYEEETNHGWHCLYFSKNTEYSDTESPPGLRLMVPSGCRVYAGCCELYWLQAGLLSRPLWTKSLSQLSRTEFTDPSGTFLYCLQAQFLKYKLNFYCDCIDKSFEKKQKRYIKVGHATKHTHAILSMYHQYSFFRISNYSEFHNQGQG